MSDLKQAKAESLSAWVTDLSQPIVLERGGQPVAVVISIEEYERYQAMMGEHQVITAGEARRKADRAMFGDLVGCALSSGEPTWTLTPRPCWRVAYRTFDGRLLTIVEVDALTGQVSLTDQDRTALLEQVEQIVSDNAPAVS